MASVASQLIAPSTRFAYTPLASLPSVHIQRVLVLFSRYEYEPHFLTRVMLEITPPSHLADATVLISHSKINHR
jgi:hypothetical protein